MRVLRLRKHGARASESALASAARQVNGRGVAVLSVLTYVDVDGDWTRLLQGKVSV